MDTFTCWRCHKKIAAPAPTNSFYVLQCPFCGAKFSFDGERVVQVTRFKGLWRKGFGYGKG